MQLVDGINGSVNSQRKSSKEGTDLERRNNRYPVPAGGRLFISKLG